MKKSILPILLLSTAFIYSHQLRAKDYTLPSGKKLENVQVLNRTPSGLDVGHKHGITHIKFKNLPKDIQEKFNYDPEAEKKYLKKEAKRKKAHAKREAAKKAQKRAADERYKKHMSNLKHNQLKVKIKQTEKRIEYLKVEIPKLEEKTNAHLNRATDLAGTPVSSDSTTSRVSVRPHHRKYYSWRGGYVYHRGGGSQRAEHTKRKVIRGIADEYASMRKTLEGYKQELHDKEQELVSMKSRLERMQPKSAN